MLLLYIFLLFYNDDSEAWNARGYEKIPGNFITFLLEILEELLLKIKKIHKFYFYEFVFFMQIYF